MKLFETHNTLFDILAAYWEQYNPPPPNQNNGSTVYILILINHWMEISNFLFTCIKTYKKISVH